VDVVDEQQPDDGTGAVRRRPFPGRRGHPPELRERAAQLRRQGVGRAEIARRLGIGFSTVCRWFRDDGLAAPPGASRLEAWRVANRRTIDERWAHQQAEQDAHRDAVGPLTERELFLVGVALYWAEGAKSKPWRRHHRLVLCNSDVGVVRTWLAWIESLGVARSRLRCRVLIHESADVEAAERFWREVVGPEPVFITPGLKRHKPVTNRRNTGEDYRGCLVITVTDGAGLYRRVAGTWEGIVAAVTSGAAE
jgi:transposase-like protein